MKVAKVNALAAPRPEERNQTQLLLELMEAIHEKLDGLAWGAEVPAQVARELAEINDTVNWRFLHVWEQRFTRLEATLERIERRLS